MNEKNYDLLADEHIEYIDAQGTLPLIVSASHTFGTDALLLADFATVHNGQKVCDFGTGCGIIPFYWLRECSPKEVWAVEIQEKACNQLTRSMQNCEKAKDIHLLHTDLRELKGKIPAGSLDIVTMNPPYNAADHGMASLDDAKKTARSEAAGTLEEICFAASYVLKFGGAFCICLRPERLSEAIVAMHNASLEPKRLRLVHQKPTDAPWLFLLEGKRGRKPGLTIEKPLCLQTESGEQSEELLRIMGSYKKN
ncbi:MAG: methyltransferase [Clostridia bacterium]|nr:methyltransferase [Clostridia bacterium]MBR3955729.1 methyltransferase [Clostridia bacterium]